MMVNKEKFLQSFKVIEKALNQKDAQFREFLEIAPEGIILFDIERRAFTTCNSSASDLLKYDKKELLNKKPEDLSPEYQPDGRRSETVITEYINRVAGGEKLVFDWWTIDGMGRAFVAEVRLVPVMTAYMPHIYISFVDVTERIQAQSRIEAQNKKLREIALLQSHQVRLPVTHILGIAGLFDFRNLNNPLNAELLKKLEISVKEFDEMIKAITLKTSEIKNNQ